VSSIGDHPLSNEIGTFFSFKVDLEDAVASVAASFFVWIVEFSFFISCDPFTELIDNNGVEVFNSKNVREEEG